MGELVMSDEVMIADCQLPIANCRFEKTNIGESIFGSSPSLSVLKLAIGNRQSLTHHSSLLSV
jgi:hypothetical protein